MSYALPQVALQRVLQIGLKYIKAHPEVMDEIFEFYTAPEMDYDYGQSYIDEVKAWFDKTHIPVVQAWTFNATRLPSISICLASEQEDESKAAIGDFFGEDEDVEIGTNVFTTMLDVNLMTDTHGDHVLWLYYIVSWISFKFKRLAESLGLQLHTFSATDYNKDSRYLMDNVWVRQLRFRATVPNYWNADDKIFIDDAEFRILVQGIGREDTIEV